MPRKEIPEDKVSAFRPENREFLTDIKRGAVPGYAVVVPLVDYHPDLMFRLINDPVEVANMTEFITYTAEYEGVPITLCGAGGGNTSTATLIDELVDAGAHTIIRLSKAGAIQEDIALGDLIISSGAVRFPGADTEYVKIGFPAVAHYEAILALVEACIELEYPFRIGVTASPASFYPGQGRPGARGYVQREHEEIIDYWRRAGVLNFELEAGAFLTLCTLFGVRAGNLDYILSNLITDESDFQLGDKSDVPLRAALEALRILAQWDRQKEVLNQEWLSTLVLKS